MATNKTLVLLAISILAIASTPLRLCRFTVRDVAFVDLGDETYRLIAYLSEDDDPGWHAAFMSRARRALAETNVIPSAVEPVARTGDSERWVRDLDLRRFPAVVLVGPGGRAIELPPPPREWRAEVAETESPWLAEIVGSPLRARVRDLALEHFCVAVLAEGDDESRNRAAADRVEAAFAEIEKVFDRMPKSVGGLPVLVTVPAAERESERILTWSLGLEVGEPGSPADPAVAIVFGRGRRVGPALPVRTSARRACSGSSRTPVSRASAASIARGCAGRGSR
jgi:hypothetical protein